MKQFIDKLIERLQEESRNAQDNMVKSTSNSVANFCSGACGAYNKTIAIVNLLAEEYKNKLVGIDTYMQVAHERDIAIEQLHELGYEFGEDINIQTIDVSELLGEQVNDGWISVKDRLPELTEGTECFKQSKCCLTTLRWWDGDMTESVGWYNQSGVWNEDSENCKVVAWMPLPPKYQPKGE